LRVEEGVVLYHEWRSWDADPYRVGPSFWIRGGQLQVGGSALLDLPVGQWLHVSVAARAGADADGRWTLTVTLPGQEPRTFEGLETGSSSFKNLTWLGWVSNAGDVRVFYLDDIELENDAE
jgi:hypothetical protein